MTDIMNNPIKIDLSGKIQKPTRDGYGEGLVLAGKADPNVVVLCADLTESTRSLAFKKEFPDRFIQMGVSEQSLAAIAAGLAMGGKVPFISSYAVFSPGRNWEQIRTNICLNEANVKIAGAHAGVSVGPDGATHQALEDIAITRVIPNMTVIYPCDAVEARKATVAAAKLPTPVYLRFAREKTPVMTADDTPFTIGKALTVRDGNDCAIISCGPLLYNALLAALALAKEGVNCRVVNNHTVKPMDEKTIITAAKECGVVVTVEEHQIAGGMGSAVAELLAQNFPVPIEFVGMRDEFGQSGEPNELIEHYGMGAKDIVAAVKMVLKRK
jgi:transketolase